LRRVETGYPLNLDGAVLFYERVGVAEDIPYKGLSLALHLLMIGKLYWIVVDETGCCHVNWVQGSSAIEVIVHTVD